MTISDVPTNADLSRIIGYLGQPVSPEFAFNRWPQDVPVLVRHILEMRREQAELLRVLHTLPLEDVEPDDTPLRLVERAQAFWLDYQQGLWGERETARLKRAKDRAEKDVEVGKAREDKLAERIAVLEHETKEWATTNDGLRATIDELTNNLAGATARDAERAQRVAVLERERAELEQRHALEMRLHWEQHVASDDSWRDIASRMDETLGAMVREIRDRMAKPR